MYKITHKDGRARVGILTTKRGQEIKTPFFMPVCTKGTVKLMTPEVLKATGSKAIISNSFILSIRPGLDVLKAHGSYREMIHWDGVQFTDSGGFQMIQPNFLLGVSEKGIHFRNPFDKNRIIFTPEKSVKIQESIGSDVAMILDDVLPYPAEYDRMEQAVERTDRWTRRFLELHSRENQLVFGINQGGVFADLRKKSSEMLSKLDVDGYALGGLAFGEPHEQTMEMIDVSLAILPEDKPRYVMGMGSPLELLEAIGRGIDIFDSRFPTMNARHGRLFTYDGFMDMRKAKYKFDTGPIEEGCDCYTCGKVTRGFIRHLLTTNEETAKLYTSIHNVTWIQTFMKKCQEAIEQGTFSEFREEFVRRWSAKNLK